MLATAIAYMEIPAPRRGPATGFYTVTQHLAFSFGVTLIPAWRGNLSAAALRS